MWRSKRRRRRKRRRGEGRGWDEELVGGKRRKCMMRRMKSNKCRRVQKRGISEGETKGRSE